jgi:hypothetical protein
MLTSSLSSVVHDPEPSVPTNVKRQRVGFLPSRSIDDDLATCRGTVESATPWREPIENTRKRLQVEQDDGLATSTGSVVESATPRRENTLNRARRKQFEKLTPLLLSLIAENDLEYGYDSALDIFLRERLDENALATKEWLNDLFIRHFSDVPVVTGVLRTVAHLDYDEICPQGITMAIAALTHANQEVNECGIRALENWATPDCLKILRQVNCSAQWLKTYVEQVIVDLEEELGSNVTARKKD